MNRTAISPTDNAHFVVPTRVGVNPDGQSDRHRAGCPHTRGGPILITAIELLRADEVQAKVLHLEKKGNVGGPDNKRTISQSIRMMVYQERGRTIVKRLSIVVFTLAIMAFSGAALAQTSILVGINMELTGYSGSQGTEQYRGIMAAHHIQPTITVGETTYHIEFSVCDNQTLREESANCATRLAGEGVVGVLGGFSSSMSIAAAPLLQERGVVQISTGSTNPVTTEIGNYIFRIPFTDDYQGQALASYAYETLGARRIVIFRQADDDYSVGLTHVVQDAFQRLGGQVQVQSFNQSTIDFSAQLNNARRFNPDVLVNTAFCTLAGPLVRQSRAMGFDQLWIGGDSLDATDCTRLGGEAFEGVRFTRVPRALAVGPGRSRAGRIRAGRLL